MSRPFRILFGARSVGVLNAFAPIAQNLMKLGYTVESADCVEDFQRKARKGSYEGYVVVAYGDLWTKPLKDVRQYIGGKPVICCKMSSLDHDPPVRNFFVIRSPARFQLWAALARKAFN